MSVRKIETGSISELFPDPRDAAMVTAFDGTQARFDHLEEHMEEMRRDQARVSQQISQDIKRAALHGQRYHSTGNGLDRNGFEIDKERRLPLWNPYCELESGEVVKSSLGLVKVTGVTYASKNFSVVFMAEKLKNTWPWREPPLDGEDLGEDLDEDLDWYRTRIQNVYNRLLWAECPADGYPEADPFVHNKVEVFFQDSNLLAAEMTLSMRIVPYGLSNDLVFEFVIQPTGSTRVSVPWDMIMGLFESRLIRTHAFTDSHLEFTICVDDDYYFNQRGITA